MSALVFLGIAVALSAAGCLFLWLRMRQPRSMDSHIRDFARELDALAPGSALDRSRQRRGPRDGDRPPPAGTPLGRGPRPGSRPGPRRERPPERETGRRSG